MPQVTSPGVVSVVIMAEKFFISLSASVAELGLTATVMPESIWMLSVPVLLLFASEVA